ncbi:hypothetical protein GCM10027425_04730 [Alteromonas gracilis]
MADFALTLDELRAVTAYAADCAAQTMVLVERDLADDPRPAAALASAREFAAGGRRTNELRRAATDAHRAGKESASESAGHAATAAGDAAAAAYLHPLAKATQLRHLLGAAAHAARAAEVERGEDPVAAEYVLDAAARRMSPQVREVLARYPRAPEGGTRVAALMHRLDHLLRDPAPEPRAVEDAGPFFHGTRADLAVGDLLVADRDTNYGSGKRSRHVYLTANRDGAALAAGLAQGDGPPRVYEVEPLGVIHDDPNVTDKRFPGNPTRSYRTTEALRVVAETPDVPEPDPALVERIRADTAALRALGIEAMD